MYAIHLAQYLVTMVTRSFSPTLISKSEAVHLHLGCALLIEKQLKSRRGKINTLYILCLYIITYKRYGRSDFATEM